VIVVSDTSPLNYLVLVEAVEVLLELFKEVYVPPDVLRELHDDRTPEPVRRWARAPPSWLKVTRPTSPFAAAPDLGPGEAQAIALAVELRATFLLMDDRDGARIAAKQGLRVVGTLAVLEQAATRGLLDLPETLDRLQQTTFRISPRLVRAALERDALRKRGPA